MPLQFFRMLLIYIYLYIVRDTPYTIGLLNCSKCSLTCGHVLLQVNDTISHIYFLFYILMLENVSDMFLLKYKLNSLYIDKSYDQKLCKCVAQKFILIYLYRFLFLISYTFHWRETYRDMTGNKKDVGNRLNNLMV